MDEAKPMLVPKLVVVTKAASRGARIHSPAGLTSTHRSNLHGRASKSYRERQKEARAAASAIRKAAEEKRRAALTQMFMARYNARKAVKQAIRDRGERVTDYTVAEIHRMAEALI
jgi:hypothetical protein